MKSFWSNPFTWFVVVVLAVVLAVATPRVSGVMGRLPAVIGKPLELKPAAVKREDDRILALITFNKSQRQEAESWIRGLKLQNEQSISWIRMPVVDDAGDPTRRAEAEGRLMAHYTSVQERSNLQPMFVNRDTFVKSTGIVDTNQAHVFVINRNGDVLARVAGGFDDGKAQIVREMLFGDVRSLGL